MDEPEERGLTPKPEDGCQEGPEEELLAERRQCRRGQDDSRGQPLGQWLELFVEGARGRQASYHPLGQLRHDEAQGEPDEAAVEVGGPRSEGQPGRGVGPDRAAQGVDSCRGSHRENRVDSQNEPPATHALHYGMGRVDWVSSPPVTGSSGDDDLPRTGASARGLGGGLRLVPGASVSSGAASDEGAASNQGVASNQGAASDEAERLRAREGDPGVALGQVERDGLVIAHQDLLLSVFARLSAEGISGDRDDLLAFGQQGLLEAAGRYDPAQGPFRRFAYFRVRGAMIDGLRKMGPWTRRGYERISMIRALDSASESVASSEGSPTPLSPDAAAERLRQHMASMVTAVTLGVFAEHAHEGAELTSKDPVGSAEELLAERRLREAVQEALAELPEPDGSIVRRHYLGGERLDLIAEEMGFSKSWASRIHSRALKKLGARLRSHCR